MDARAWATRANRSNDLPTDATVHVCARRPESRRCEEPTAHFKELKARLRSSDYASIRCLSCSFRNGRIEINGTLPSYYLKQLVQQRVLQMKLNVHVSFHGLAVSNM